MKYYSLLQGHHSYISNVCDCFRIHLKHRIEDEDQCRVLIKDLQEQIKQAYPAEIQDEEVLHEDYIRRMLQFRKVTITARFLICIQIMLPRSHILLSTSPLE